MTFDEAVARVTGLARPLDAETVPVGEAAGRILASDVVARLDSPRAAVSAMDGYAVRSADVAAGGARLRLIGRSLPGVGYDGPIGQGEAVRIFTGAPVPAGADRVVMQEDVVLEGELVRIDEAQASDSHVRARASDFAAGAVLLAAGRRLDPRGMVVAAAADLEAVEVYRRPGVMILSAGDDLYDPGTAHLTRFGAPESVSLGVGALAEAWGGRVLGRRRLPDDLKALKAAAAQALQDADLVVMIGGASVGERDFGRAMFEDGGLELAVSEVEIRPGRLAWLGRSLGKLVLGLPGNAGASLLVARLFLAPLLAGLSGADPKAALEWRGERLASALRAAGGRESFIRARRTPDGLDPAAERDAASRKRLADTDVLIRRRAGAHAVEAGGFVETLDF